MAEKVKSVGVRKESGYLYYIGKDGNVWRAKMARAGKKGGGARKVAEAHIRREEGFLYYVGKDGHVWRAKMAQVKIVKKSSHKYRVPSIKPKDGYEPPPPPIPRKKK